MNTYSMEWSDGFVLDVVNGCIFTPRGGNPLKNFGSADGMSHSWFAQFDGKKEYRFTVGNCLTRFVVPEAGITYTIDSSD